MRYVTFDESGALTGAYIQDLHPDHTAVYLEVDGVQYANWTSYKANAERDGVEVAPVIERPPVVPPLVSKFQAKAALLNAGHLATVEAIMSNQATPELMRLAWTEAQEFRRDSPTVAAMAAALDLTDEDVDNLFVYAEGVSA